MIEKENDGLKKNTILKDKEIKGLIERLNEAETRQAKLEHEINEYREKLLQKDRKNNEALESQKIRLEVTFYFIQEISRLHCRQSQVWLRSCCQVGSCKD